jgi:hypothetical protein
MVQMYPITPHKYTKMLQKKPTIDHRMEKVQGMMEITNDRNLIMKLRSD